jgi:hypothetical protein
VYKRPWSKVVGNNKAFPRDGVASTPRVSLYGSKSTGWESDRSVAMWHMWHSHRPGSRSLRHRQNQPGAIITRRNVSNSVQCSAGLADATLALSVTTGSSPEMLPSRTGYKRVKLTLARCSTGGSPGYQGTRVPGRDGGRGTGDGGRGRRYATVPLQRPEDHFEVRGA